MESAISASPCAPVGDHLALEHRIDADVVRDRGQDRRVLGEVDRRARRPAVRRRAEVRHHVHRVGRRARRCRAPAAGRRPSNARAQASRPPPAAPRSPRSSVWRRSSPTSSAFISTEARTSSMHRVEVGLALGQERIEEARRARRRGPCPRCGPRAARGARRTRAPAPTARGRGSRPAPARTNGSSAGGSNSHSAPRVREGDREAAALPREPQRLRNLRRPAPKAIAMSSGSAIRSTWASSGPPSCASPIAGSARLPTITGCTNSTATWRTSERAAGEPPNATSRPPRAKRSAIRWHSRAMPLGLLLEEPRVRVACAARAAPRCAGCVARARSRASRGRRGPLGRARQPLTPLLDALAGARADQHASRRPGFTFSRLWRKRSRSKSRWGSRSTLLTRTSSQVRNISGYLSGLSSPSVTDDDHHAHVLADPELGRAHEVADVLDHEQVDPRPAAARESPSAPCSRRGGTRRRSPGRC